jgi:probable F420-dependent oxidoreductase
LRYSVKLQNALSIDENLLLAKLAERCCLDGVWVSEYADRDAVTQLSAIARATEKITVGVSIIPIYTRSPVVLGMTAASLAELAPDRVKMGIGVSSRVIVESWHGMAWEQPITAIREYVEAIRQVLARERVSVSGEVVNVDGFPSAIPSGVGSIEIPIAALGPVMRRLAGEIGDGLLLNMTTADHLRRTHEIVREGAARVERAAPPVMSDIRMGVLGRQPESELRTKLRRLVASYGRVPSYNRHYAELGFPEQAGALAAAWVAEDMRAAVDAVDDEMRKSLVVIGTGEEIAARLTEYRDAGLDEAIVYPTIVDGDEVRGLQEAIEIVAEARSAS